MEFICRKQPTSRLMNHGFEEFPELVVLFNAGIDGCLGTMAFLYKPRLYCYRRNVGFYPNEILHWWTNETQILGICCMKFLHGGGPPQWTEQVKILNIQPFFGLILKKTWFPCWTCKIHPHHHCNSGYLERVSGGKHQSLQGIWSTYRYMFPNYSKFQPLNVSYTMNICINMFQMWHCQTKHL